MCGKENQYNIAKSYSYLEYVVSDINSESYLSTSSFCINFKIILGITSKMFVYDCQKRMVLTVKNPN